MRVHITDDHHLIVEGLKNLLVSNNIEVVGTSSNGVELIAWLQDNTADIIILDVYMPKLNGIEVLTHFTKNKINQKTILLSSELTKELLEKSHNLGAKGYLLKEEAYSEIIIALQTVYDDDEIFYSKGVKRFIVLEKPTLLEKPLGLDFDYLESNLSPQELRVLSLLCKGLNSNEISEKTNISTSTIRTYLKRAREKLKIKTNIGLVIGYGEKFKKLT
tara:strand:+ start:5820 stop:6473 length:654 start_codon:yes stop_codon:yes gene_type:complete